MATTCRSACYSDALNITKAINSKSNYSLTLYPNFGTNQPMLIYVYFVLVKLMELANRGTFSVAGTLVTSWLDLNLAWNKTAHNNVINVEVLSSRIWRPNLILINAVSKAPLSLDAGSISTVDYYGRVTAIMSKIFNAACPIDITYFPFDTQTCTLKIGNIDLGSKPSETIHFVPVFPQVNTEMFSDGGEFTLIGSNITNRTYDLPQSNYSFNVVNVTFTFKRNPSYYLVNVAMPCVIILFCSGLIFFLPSDNNVKIAMACSLFMALYVLQQAVSRVLPTTPTVPLLATGIMIELGLGCYSVLCAVATVVLRALQPPLCPCCVKLIKTVERVFLHVPTQNNKTLVPTTETIEDNSNAVQMRSRSRSDRLTDTVSTLVQNLKAQAECKEVKKCELAERLRHWKVLDFMLNFFLFLVYLICCLYFGLKYLLGIGI